MKKIFTLLLTICLATVASAQKALDFAQKFMTTCDGDTMVKCITVSPKMMEQIVDAHQEGDEHSEALKQAISKLKSMRLVTAPAEYYERAEQLLKKHSRRFKPEQEFQTDSVRGIFYTRQDRKQQIAELIMLREETIKAKLIIICLTGHIDKEFLCFLYKNKSLKD